ncbi:MAG: P-loop NTPase fold protein [Candidatus Nitrosopolaris sp.]
MSSIAFSFPYIFQKFRSRREILCSKNKNLCRKVDGYRSDSDLPKIEYTASQETLDDTYDHYTRIISDEIEYAPIPLHNFDFERYSETLAKLIRNSAPKFSVGIYGKWGTGKTTLMQLIERKLKGHVFVWNDITENGNYKRLKVFLKEKLGASWINDELKFIKNDDNTITLSQDSHFLSFLLDYEKKR